MATERDQVNDLAWIREGETQTSMLDSNRIVSEVGTA